MPGIVGVVSRGGGGSCGTGSMLAALSHFDSYRARAVDLGSGVALGQVWRDRDGSDRDWAVDPARGVAIAVNGSVIEDGIQPRRLPAQELLARYLRHDALNARAFDGFFVVAIADSRKRSTTVVNDHVGSLPVYYLVDEAGFYFAPEAKGIFAAASVEPRLSKTGLLSFLSCGYCLGETTLFEDVSCLTPGSMLEFSSETGRARVARYWKTIYRPDPSLGRRRTAESTVYEVTRRAHEIAVGDSRNGFELMLTGGWDSRGVLAFLADLGRLPTAAFGWGLREDIPDSDPYLAARLAERFGVPFRFLGYDSGQLPHNAGSWCYLSELANDNIGWFAEGASVLARDYATGADFSIVGDEAWGWHGHPKTETDVRNANLPSSLGPELRACLRRGEVDECAALYEAEIDRVLEDCDNEHPFDRRDFLYLHGRVARFIFALGYYKELAVEIRRPFLFKSVLETMAQVPRRFRADKNLYVSMLCRYFPEIAAVPQRRARSLPDWRHDVRSKNSLRRFFLDLLDRARLGDGALGELLDPDAVAELSRAFFEAPAGPAAAAPGGRRLGRALSVRTKQRITASGLYPGSSEMTGAYPSRGPFDLLRCIAFVVLLEQMLPSFAAQRSKQASPGEGSLAAASTFDAERGRL